MMTRKQFLGSLAGLLGTSAFIAACTKSDDDGDVGDIYVGEDAGNGSGSGSGSGSGNNPDAGVMMDGEAAACTTPEEVIGGNHGHVLVVPQTDLDAGAEKSYDIQGSAGHAHTVLITAAMFTTLKTSRTVQTTSSSGAGHTHPITVTC
jgi:hypothetical protein